MGVDEFEDTWPFLTDERGRPIERMPSLELTLNSKNKDPSYSIKILIA